MKNYIKKLLFSFISGCIISIIFFWLSGVSFFKVFPGSLFIATIGLFILSITFPGFKKNHTLSWIIILGFLLRFGFGIFTTISLPEIGYDEVTQNEGYLFRDAFNRDTQAWDVSKTEKPIFNLLNEEFVYDQYGGVLVISTFIYKFFSTDYHNKLLIIFLASIVSSVGISFVWKTLHPDKQIQLIGTIIYTFYPDSILFSASQMREPFLLGLSAILFWLVNTESKYSKGKIISFLIVSISILVISAKIGVFIIGFAIIWFYMKNSSRFSVFNLSKPILIFMTFISIGFGILGLRWIMDVGKWDAILALNSSGWIQAIFKQLPEFLHLPFITVYGLLQPVLPAAIVEPSISFWKTLGIIRALGWFVLSSLFLYCFVFVIKNKSKEQKIWLVVLGLLSFWIVLSSLRAGGDLWDNPRYRLSLLIPLSMIIATSTAYAIRTKDHWFWRIFAGLGILNAFFLQWYISRYTNVWGKLDFPIMIGLIIMINILIIAQGIYQDLKSRSQKIIQ